MVDLSDSVIVELIDECELGVKCVDDDVVFV